MNNNLSIQILINLLLLDPNHLHAIDVIVIDDDVIKVISLLFRGRELEGVRELVAHRARAPDHSDCGEHAKVADVPERVDEPVQGPWEIDQLPLDSDFETKEKMEDKWLGQIISSAGLAASVARIVVTKEGKIKGACLEIAIIVNDWRAQTVGGLETALMLWEACCIPSMLHAAGTWVDINKQTENKLNSLQIWFFVWPLELAKGPP